MKNFHLTKEFLWNVAKTRGEAGHLRKTWSEKVFQRKGRWKFWLDVLWTRNRQRIFHQKRTWFLETGDLLIFLICKQVKNVIFFIKCLFFNFNRPSLKKIYRKYSNKRHGAFIFRIPILLGHFLLACLDEPLIFHFVD